MQPDALFTAEFGEGELSKRLWRGGLRASPDGYRLEKDTYVLTNALRDGLDARFEDSTLQAIVTDLESCWDDTGRLRRACVPLTVTGGGGGARTYSGAPLSLAKHMLGVDVLQPSVAQGLVNKLSELGGGEESAAGDALDDGGRVLDQLRWLPFIVDGTALCDSLLAILPVVDAALQKRIIEAMPEILDDASKPRAVAELIESLDESPALMGSIIDALASLGVDDDRLDDVNAVVISSLGAANRDILPVTIRYLLRTCRPPLVDPTVAALRNVLALPSLGPAAGRLCLDAVMRSLRASKVVAAHIVKTLRATDAHGFRPADVWMTLALYDSPGNRKAAEVMFKKKAAAGAITGALLDGALAPFAHAFSDFSSLIITLASVVLKSPDIAARKAGITVYAKLFRLFAEGSTRRNVVASLVEHASSRKAVEVDTALSALVAIAKQGVDDRSVLPYSAAIQNLLDHLETFSDPQLRQLWSVLGYVCCASGKKRAPSSGSSAAATGSSGASNGAGAGKRKRKGQSDAANKENQVDKGDMDGEGEQELQMLEILLRKELNHPDTMYRRIGVIGACTMIKVLGDQVENNILELLLDVGRTHPFSQAVAFDQLSELFTEDKSGSEGISQVLHRSIQAIFENKYINDLEPMRSLSPNDNVLPPQMFGNLEPDGSADIYFGFARVTRKKTTMKDCQDAVRSMIPNLRLLCVLTKLKHDGLLEEIDGMIGAPIHIPTLPDGTLLEDVPEDARKDLLLHLFLVHGWFVELVNEYAEQESSEFRAKCIMRMDNILDVMAKISELIPKVPMWKDVLFDSYNGTRDASQTVSKAKAGPGRKKKATKDKVAETPSSEWKKWSRQLNASALSLIRIQHEVTWRYTETMSASMPKDQPDYLSIALSNKSLHYLLVELGDFVKSITGGSFRSQAAFAITMFHSASAAAVKKDSRYVDGGGIDGGLSKLYSLKIALESLAPQLRRCLDKVLTAGGDDAPSSQAEDDDALKVYRECAILCLKSLSLVLNSSVLSDDAAMDLLFSLLASIRLDDDPIVDPSDPLSKEDVHAAARCAFDQIFLYVKRVLPGAATASSETRSAGSKEDAPAPDDESRAEELHFDGCCALLAALDSILHFCAEQHRERLGQQLSAAAHAVMNQAWPAEVLRDRKAQKLFPGLVRMHVQLAAEPVGRAAALESMVTKQAVRQAERARRHVSSQDAGRTGLTQSDSLGSLGEQTFYVYAIAVLDQYIHLFKQFKPGSYEQFDDAHDRLLAFLDAENSLYALARYNEQLLGPVMKAGRIFVEVFLNGCLPYLNDKFRSNRPKVLAICKKHQKFTRQLHAFCAHSKSTKDSSLTALVPPLRRCLELSVYQTKNLFSGHNASIAFQVGNLKHRNIAGELVSSQQMSEEPELEDEDNGQDEDERDDDQDEYDLGMDEDGDRLVDLSDKDEDERMSKSSTKKKSNSAKQKKAAPPAKRKPNRSSKQVSKPPANNRKAKKRKVSNPDPPEEDEDQDMDEMMNDVPLDAEESEESIEVVRRSGKRRTGTESIEETSGRRPTRDVNHTQRPRCRLIDDEAGGGSEEEDYYDEEEGVLASQFIVEDDEVEE